MNIGGVAVLINTLLTNLDSKKYDLLLITGKCEAGEGDYLDSNPHQFEVVKFNFLRRNINFFYDISAFISISRYLNKHKPDIIHTHTSKAGTLGRISALFFSRKSKIVHTYHGEILNGYFSKFARSIIILIERTLSRKTDLLISMGSKVKSNLLKVGIGHNKEFITILPGVEDKFLEASKLLAARKDKIKAKTTCIYVGRITEIKRCDRIIELASREDITNAGINFLIVGDGELRETLEKRSVGLPIKWVGWQNNINLFMENSDISILLSDNEAVPLALVESCLAGLPIVATDVGSTSEIVIDGQNGFLVKRDIDLIAKKLIILAESPELRNQMGSWGRIFASQNASINSFVERHQEAYTKILKQ